MHLLPAAERICENGAAPASSGSGGGGEDSVGGGANIGGGERIVTAKSVEEVGVVDAVLGLGSPWKESKRRIVVCDFAALIVVIGLLQQRRS